MKVLQLTAHFRPNIGGVETHLNDLCESLVKRNYEVEVLTYRPLQTKAEWRIIERQKDVEIIRLPWIPNLFYKLVKNPVLEFIYLLPGLFFLTPFILLIKKINLIHAHGLVAGFVGIFWGKIFAKRVVISTHSIYNFPKKGLYRNFVYLILKNADFCLGLSEQSILEIQSLGVPYKKVGKFTYWIDLDKFKKIENAKSSLGWEDEFIILFVGRLVEEKGIIELLESAKEWDKNISIKIIGSGPLEDKVRKEALRYKNVEFIGGIDQDRLSVYYSASDLLIVPSISEEGFGRVILEALACGTPVIGARRGAISEVLDKTVGQIIDISPENIRKAVQYFYEKRDALKKLSRNCRKFAERRYSEKNVETIIRAYQS